jgi:hypothetical protein
MYVLLDFAALVLAGDAVITAWFYGSIFENRRAYFEKRGGLLGELMGCSLCLSYHVCLWLALLLWLTIQLCSNLPGNWPLLAFLPRAVLYAFAATDLVHWLQGDRPIPVEEDDNDYRRKGDSTPTSEI